MEGGREGGGREGRACRAVNWPEGERERGRGRERVGQSTGQRRRERGEKERACRGVNWPVSTEDWKFVT